MATKQAAHQPTNPVEQAIPSDQAAKAAVAAAQEKLKAATPPPPSPVAEPDSQQPGAARTEATESEAVQTAVAAIGELLDSAKEQQQDGNLGHLKCWHGSGKILQSFLGDKARHPYGLKVVEEAAQRFKVAKSELHRAAKFYRLHPEFDAFCTANPKVNTWSKVKAWLPREGDETEEQRQRKKHRALVARVHGGLKQLRDGLAAGLKASVAEGDMLDLVTDLKQTTEKILADDPAADESATA